MRGPLSTISYPYHCTSLFPHFLTKTGGQHSPLCPLSLSLFLRSNNGYLFLYKLNHECQTGDGLGTSFTDQLLLTTHLGHTSPGVQVQEVLVSVVHRAQNCAPPQLTEAFALSQDHQCSLFSLQQTALWDLITVAGHLASTRVLGHFGYSKPGNGSSCWPAWERQ